VDLVDLKNSSLIISLAASITFLASNIAFGLEFDSNNHSSLRTDSILVTVYKEVVSAFVSTIPVVWLSLKSAATCFCFSGKVYINMK
jgi:uncharacterized membrane protein